MDPAYCGLTTLVLVLNALAMDPNVRWRGGWRFYGDESMLLERCCLEEERVARVGVTLEQFCGLARCQGVRVVRKRPGLKMEDDDVEDGQQQQQQQPDEAHGAKYNHSEVVEDDTTTTHYSLEEFRRDIIRAVQHPPHTHWDDTFQEEEEETTNNNTAATTISTNNAPSSPQAAAQGEGYFLVTSFARQSLDQTGDGHFSPIAAYHAPTDSCLVLDVARFKYSSYWVGVTELYEAMMPADTVSGLSRGWMLMYPPEKKEDNDNSHHKKKRGRNKEEMEGKRPAACVPLAGTGGRICAVERIKVEYCPVK